MLDPDALCLPTAPCAACEREVLIAWTLDADDALVPACVHCDAPLTALEEQPPRLTDRDALDALGYVLPPEESPRHGQSGCRGGRCGVQQPGA